METQKMLRKCEDDQAFLKMIFRFVTAFDLKEGLKQIKLMILLNSCAPISELPSNISIVA